MARPAKYTNDQIKQLIEQYHLSGLNVSDAADHLGVERRLLYKWLKDAKHNPADIPEIGMDQRKKISKRALGLVNKMLASVTEDDIRKAGLAARFSAIKVGLEVAQILDGEPTSITVQKMTEEKRMEVLLDLMHKIEERREKQAALPAPEKKPIKEIPAWATKEKLKALEPDLIEPPPTPIDEVWVGVPPVSPQSGIPAAE